MVMPRLSSVEKSHPNITQSKLQNGLTRWCRNRRPLSPKQRNLLQDVWLRLLFGAPKKTFSSSTGWDVTSLRYYVLRCAIRYLRALAISRLQQGASSSIAVHLHPG